MEIEKYLLTYTDNKNEVFFVKIYLSDKSTQYSLTTFQHFGGNAHAIMRSSEKLAEIEKNQLLDHIDNFDCSIIQQFKDGVPVPMNKADIINALAIKKVAIRLEIN